MPLVAEIGYPLRLERTYDYEVPPSLEGAVAPGMRIRAPFGPRSAVGVVFSVRDASASPPLRRLKALEAVLDSEPAMTSELLDLCRWLARRYCCSLGECLRLLFPAHMLAKKRELKSAPLPEGLPQEPRPGQAAFQLTGSQSAALGRLEAALDSKTFSAHLIFGVPASGKTEVYLRLIRKAVQGEGQALFLVPEIALTQPFYEQFSADLGLPTALWHSQLGVRERREVWLGLRSGALRVVVGPRSASLLPFKRLRLAVMDEEQDESYKQDGQVPYYHARDVLLERARRAGALAVLGSATPSVESYSSVQAGLLGLVEMNDRVSARTSAPPIRLIDMPSTLSRCISGELLEALKARLQRREQAILLVNRRGFSNFLICRRCGFVPRCEACEVALIHHHDEGTNLFHLSCHHCGKDAPIPSACGKCGRPDLAQSGVGTQKIVAELRAVLPGVRVLRMDGDTVAKRSAEDAVYKRFLAGEAELLVGTKLVAKGYHFPRVTLVGVVDADTMLQMPDFRSAERTVQMLLQAAGRAGRAERPGEVLIQTASPAHYAMQAVARCDFSGFCRQELEHRRGLRYPPASALVRLVFSAKTLETARRAAEAAAAALRAALPLDEVLGPAPALLKRFQSQHRFHLLLKVADPSRIDAAHAALRDLKPSSAVRLKVNVDPYDFV
ncbi:MAG TPA: primosomal protein N' [Elusimicrobia bacterium]|nr:primosomal protein N' [Elusimicrobiota bacterium]